MMHELHFLFSNDPLFELPIISYCGRILAMVKVTTDLFAECRGIGLLV